MENYSLKYSAETFGNIGWEFAGWFDSLIDAQQAMLDQRKNWPTLVKATRIWKREQTLCCEWIAEDASPME